MFCSGDRSFRRGPIAVRWIGAINRCQTVNRPRSGPPTPPWRRRTGTDLGPLVWRGLLLTVVTLGIYRFWYRTDLRRWYWRNTVVGGNSAEYRGTAKELLIGFLFALAVLLPLYLLSAYVGLFVGKIAEGLMRPVFGAIFVFLVQYGAFRSRRYRLTRTVWRGLRFNQTGSAVGYALRSIGWFLATGLTLGLLFPVMRRALERYKIEHTWFGTAQGSFDAPLKPLMMRWLLLLLPFILLISVFGFAVASSRAELGNVNSAPQAVFFLIFLCAVWPPLAWPFYRAAEMRTFVSGTMIGPVRFHSRLDTRRLYVLFAKIIGLTLLLIVAIGLIVAMLAPAIFMTAGRGTLSPGVLVVPAILYLGAFIGSSALKELVFNQGLWRHTIATLWIENLEAVDQVIGSSVATEAATGEGLADALDFGGV